MDNRAAEQYLNKLFGDRAGHVAVAYKDKGSSWQECQFAWPADRQKLLGWAKVHSDANIFICPSLRQDAHTRKKGDMLPGQWLWADVDWQGIPQDKRAEVQGRIDDLGSLVVWSGSGDNVHVYVQLSKPVPHEEFIKLNTGLRDYLYADNKQADNSLLRLPGTTNWKTEAGTSVRVAKANGRKFAPSTLMKRRAFRDARVAQDVEASDWSFVTVEGLPRRLQRMINMTTQEALGRYGKRYKAVRAVVTELFKRDFGTDEIHSLMDKFPPALDKMAEENGYDLHLDIDRCLSVARATAILTDEQAAEIEEEAFEIATEEDDAQERDNRILKLALAELERSEARKRARTMEAERSWVPPPDDVSWSLTDALKDPPRPVPHLIDGLAGQNHNVVITAQYKTGKTAFTLGCIVASLVDGHDFLDKFPVNVPDDGVVVGHWNCEMDPAEMLDDYIRPVGMDHTENLHVANLRGYRVNLLSEVGKRWTVEWLKQRKVQVWTIDSFARLARMAGVSEKDNDEVMTLLMALDEVKVEAGVQTLFLITHTGRAEMEEGKERARGATAIDDWADARWIMTKVDKARLFRVEGRGVGHEEITLVFDPETKRSVIGFGGRTEVREDTVKDTIVKIVVDNPGITQSNLLKQLKTLNISQRAAMDPLDDAIEGGFIEIREEPSLRGGRASKTHWPAGSLKGETSRHNATPRPVDMRGVRVRTARKS